MSARAIRGGGRAPSRAKHNGGGSRSVSTRRKPRQTDSMFEGLGLEPNAARKLLRWSFLALIVITLTATVFAFRLPQLAGLAVGEGIGKLGFTLKHVETRGNQRVSTQAIYDIAFNQQSSAMPLVDLDGTRERLLRLPWIREARVSRRLPDTMVIDVIERVPVAVWQQHGRFHLVDAEGVVLEPVGTAMPDLVRLIGPEAHRNYASLNTLFGAAPRLRPMITDATWVGQRRWDLHFQGGEILSLPEGEGEARRAIERFAQMDQRDSLLGRGFARIDMRDPRRVYIRISREPGARVPEAPPAPSPGQPPPNLAETI